VTQERFLSLFTDGWTLQDHMILQSSKPIGILNPSCLLMSHDEQLYIKGKRGIFPLIVNNIEDFILTLFSSGSLLPGNHEEITHVSSLLLNPECSRTYSYFCSLADTCSEIVNYETQISKSHISIIGCGGIGSISAVLLAGIGIKKFTLVDFDRIEISNLNRQILYSKKDVGKLKVDVLTREMLNRYNNLKISKINNKIASDNYPSIIKKSTGIIVTADEPIGVHLDIIKIANEENIPVISCGYSINESKLFLSPKVNDSNKNSHFHKLPQGIMPSYGPTNSEVAGIATSVLLQSILGTINPKLQNIEMVWNNVSFPR
jgi:hypothetical protein